MINNKHNKENKMTNTIVIAGIEIDENTMLFSKGRMAKAKECTFDGTEKITNAEDVYLFDNWDGLGAPAYKATKYTIDNSVEFDVETK